MFSHIFTRKSEPKSAAKPEQVEHLLPKFRRIAVPATGAPFSNRALKTAARLACTDVGAEIKLVYLMEVPRAFSLSASLPDEDAFADSVLCEGLRVLGGYGSTATTEVQRGRDVAGMLTKWTAQQEIDLLILGARSDNVRGISLELAKDLYGRLPCPIILDYIAGDQTLSLTNQTSEAAMAAAP